jgi:hypothetical protein
MTISIHSPHQLIGAVPALLGFQPEESIVIDYLGHATPTKTLNVYAHVMTRDNGAVTSVFDGP